MNEIIVGNWSKLRQLKNGEISKRCASADKYQKSPEIKKFEAEYNAHKYDNKPEIPVQSRIRTRFSDKTANELTKAIIAHLEFHGHFATRINTVGIYDSKRGQYRYTTARKGMADIFAIISGESVQLEIKAGKDKPSEAQLRVQSEVRAAGGIYEFIHSFAEYILLYSQICE